MERASASGARVPASPMAGLSVLVAEDDSALRTLLSEALIAVGHRVHQARDGTQASSLVKRNVYQVVISDVRLPGLDGMALFRQVRRESPRTDVILTTAYGSVSDAVAALREGACDYLTKPFDIVRFALGTVARIAERHAALDELDRAGADPSGPSDGAALVGRSPAMSRVLDRLSALARSEAPVLITGETGTGKELVARTLHAQSPRHAGPWIAVNCAAFPEMLLEAELFGHERGAFTGAVKKRDGRFRAAHGGTLFLDEVAEMPLAAQAKLLRVLQEGRFEPLGTNQQVQVDVRIVSATNRSPKEAIAAGRFREDLYYRLNVLDLALPPLRDRSGDLPLLVELFLRRFAPPDRPAPAISPRAWAALAEYPFPGNVRELEHLVERAVVMSRGAEIGLEHLPPDVAGPLAEEGEPEEFRPLSAALHEFEREYLARALRQAGGHRQRAAAMLGISRKNLWEKLKAHGLSSGEQED